MRKGLGILLENHEKPAATRDVHVHSQVIYSVHVHSQVIYSVHVRVRVHVHVYMYTICMYTHVYPFCRSAMMTVMKMLRLLLTASAYACIMEVVQDMKVKQVSEERHKAATVLQTALQHIIPITDQRLKLTSTMLARQHWEKVGEPGEEEGREGRGRGGEKGGEGGREGKEGEREGERKEGGGITTMLARQHWEKVGELGEEEGGGRGGRGRGEEGGGGERVGEKEGEEKDGRE